MRVISIVYVRRKMVSYKSEYFRFDYGTGTKWLLLCLSLSPSSYGSVSRIFPVMKDVVEEGEGKQRPGP